MPKRVDWPQNGSSESEARSTRPSVKPLSHGALVDIAVAWLLRGPPTTHVSVDGDVYKGVKHRCKPVFAEMVSTGATNERPDAIGWHWGSSIVVECKVSRADFLSDRSKVHMMDPTWGMGRRRYYLVPTDLVKVDEVPTWCGLAYTNGTSVKVVKEAPVREICASAAMTECSFLASAVRRWALKVPFDERRGRFETIEARSPTKTPRRPTRKEIEAQQAATAALILKAIARGETKA